MKVIEVAVNYGETVNIGNYESRRVDYYARATLDPGEEPEVVRRQLLLDLRRGTKEAVDRIIAADRH